MTTGSIIISVRLEIIKCFHSYLLFSEIKRALVNKIQNIAVNLITFLISLETSNVSELAETSCVVCWHSIDD